MNRQKVAFLFIAVFTFCLPGCGLNESEQDRLVREFGEKVNELGTIYQSITDEQSARAAVPRMEQLSSDMSQIQSGLNELPDVSDEEYQRVVDAVMESTKKTREHTQRLTELFQKKPELVPILAPALDRLKAAFNNGRTR